MNKFNLYDLFPNYFVLVQSGGGGGNLANTILEDEVMAEHNEDTSLLSACRNLMTSITKVRIYDVRYFPKDIFLNSNFPREFSLVATSQMCKCTNVQFFIAKSSYIVKMLAKKICPKYEKLYIFEKLLTMPFQICKIFFKI